MTERYDHRTEDARAADGTESAVLDRPVETGAAELQREVVDADRHGTLVGDSAEPQDHRDAR